MEGVSREGESGDGKEVCEGASRPRDSSSACSFLRLGVELIEAWGLATQTQRQRDSVLAAEADSYFSAGRYIQSAQAYAQSSKPFEEVVLRFVDKDERDALRYFLVAKLERLKRSVRSRFLPRPVLARN